MSKKYYILTIIKQYDYNNDHIIKYNNCSIFKIT